MWPSKRVLFQKGRVRYCRPEGGHFNQVLRDLLWASLTWWQSWLLIPYLTKRTDAILDGVGTTIHTGNAMINSQTEMRTLKTANLYFTSVWVPTMQPFHIWRRWSRDYSTRNEKQLTIAYRRNSRNASICGSVPVFRKSCNADLRMPVCNQKSSHKIIDCGESTHWCTEQWNARRDDRNHCIAFLTCFGFNYV